MKRLFLLSLFFVNISVVFAQEITLEAEENMDGTKFEQTLRMFEGYVYYDFKLVGEEDTMFDFQIIEKEFVNGK